MTITIVTAKQWCGPCRVGSTAIQKVAKARGVSIGEVDLGSKRNFNENKGKLLDSGYDEFYSVPSFFKDKKKIRGPKSWSITHINEWIDNLGI